MTEEEAIELLQNLNVKLTEMAGHKENRIEKIFGWNEITGICEAIKALEEIQQYRAIGTVNEFKSLKEDWLNKFDRLIEYRKIGTVEECRAAVEKQKEMKAYCDENDCADCPYHNTNSKHNKCMNDFIAD